MPHGFFFFGKRNKNSLQREQKWNNLFSWVGPALETGIPRLEDEMVHFARDVAAFGSLVCFCATLAVWGDVLMAFG